MALSVHHVLMSDRATLANIIIAANFDDPYGQTVWPNSTFEERVAGTYARLPMTMLGHGAWFMRVKTSDNRTIAYAQWTLPTVVREQVVGGADDYDLQALVTDEEKREYERQSDASCNADGWPKGMRNEVVEACSPAMAKARREAFPQNEEYIMLDQVKTLPESQRKGAGSLLVEWGVRLADQFNLKICLEATPFGMSLYEKFGFQARAVVHHDVSKFGGPACYTHTLMVREPQPQGSRP